MKNNSKKADRIQDPPKLAVKFANAVFVLGLLFSVFVVSFYIYRLYKFWTAFNPDGYIYIGYSEQELYKHYLKSLITGGISATLFGLGLRRLSNGLKVNLSLLIFITGISVYAFETYLELQLKQKRKEIATEQIETVQKMAEKMGVPYDTREPIEVLEDLRKDGIEAYPNVSPSVILFSDSSYRNGLNARGGKVLPLGGISNITTILTNESGYYPIIETDEHGFNNSKGLYKKNKVNIMLTGDSFTEGYSVHSDETISAVLRKSGFNAISVGKGGNGPLIELAVLKEYAEPLEPKIVFWLYYANDIDDLGNEMNSSFLIKYLNEDDF